MTSEKTPKNTKIFLCDMCDFKCCKNSEYSRHLTTYKHVKLENSNNLQFNCECGKYYTHSSSYYRHKKICISNDDNKKCLIVIKMN